MAKKKNGNNGPLYKIDMNEVTMRLQPNRSGDRSVKRYYKTADGKTICVKNGEDPIKVAKHALA